MATPLEADIAERIRKEFPAADAERALELMKACGEHGRVARCIVVASQGSLESLKHYIAMAKADYRDVIVAGEYDPCMCRIRDLSISFLIDAPEKMWVSDVANTMAARGYTLVSLESRTAPPDSPIRYTTDPYEGVARFLGPKGEIVIEKANREWTLHGDSAELALHDLQRPFTSTKEFCDAISRYLLATTARK